MQRRVNADEKNMKIILFYSAYSSAALQKNIKGSYETLRFAHFALRAQGPHPDPGEEAAVRIRRGRRLGRGQPDSRAQSARQGAGAGAGQRRCAVRFPGDRRIPRFAQGAGAAGGLGRGALGHAALAGAGRRRAGRGGERACWNRAVPKRSSRRTTSGARKRRSRARWNTSARRLGNGPWLVSDRFTLADLVVAVALEYTDFRYPHDWRGRHPRLGQWLAGVSARPSFIETRPPGMEKK